MRQGMEDFLINSPSGYSNVANAGDFFNWLQGPFVDFLFAQVGMPVHILAFVLFT